MMPTIGVPVLLIPAAVLLIAAGPMAASNLLREANAAAQADPAAAIKLYEAAEEQSNDPGFVAFNEGVLLVRGGEFRSAELCFQRVLGDQDCPPERAARAWFNRGVCLLRRNNGAGTLRSAVACFEQSLARAGTDESLSADARFNLELAKLLWAKANQKVTKPEKPDDAPGEEQFDRTPKKSDTPAASENQPGDTAKKDPQRVQPVPTIGKVTGTPKETPARTAGNNSALPPIKEDNQTHPLPPDETREHLRRAAERLRREERAMLRTLYGPDQPGVKDW